jgi:hypothetical protein
MRDDRARVEEAYMPLEPLGLRNENLPPTKPTFSTEEPAFRAGAYAGLCFALALISAVVVYVAMTPTPAKMDTQAWAPTVTATPNN